MNKITVNDPHKVLPNDNDVVVIKMKDSQYNSVIYSAERNSFYRIDAPELFNLQLVEYKVDDVQWWINAKDIPKDKDINLDKLSCEE